MGFFRRLLAQIIPETQLERPEDSSEELIRETIERGTAFYQAYKSWKKDGNQQGILIQLYRSAALKAENQNAEVNYFTYRSKHANGFYFHGEHLWSVEDYEFFVQYLIDFLCLEGYRQAYTQRRVIEKHSGLLTTEKFYLKPELKYSLARPAEQLFGNIIIEHKIVNEKTNYIKLMAQVYHGRAYRKAKNFEDLMHKLFVS